MSSPRRYSNGVTNVASDKTMGMLIIPDPTSVHTFMDDFHEFDPGDWFITRSFTGGNSGGTGGETITDATNGILQITLSAVDNDSTFINWKGANSVSTASECWALTSGKKLWFKSRFKLSNTGDCDFIMGLMSADTTPLTSPADGVWIQSDEDDDYLGISAYKSSAAVLTDANIGTIVDDTWFTSGFYFDGAGAISYFYNDVVAATSIGVDYPTNQLSIAFGAQNGASAATVMSVDYICVIAER